MDLEVNRTRPDHLDVRARLGPLLLPAEFAVMVGPTSFIPLIGRSRDSVHLLIPPSRPVHFTNLRMHQHLAKLQAIARRVAKGGKFHHARNFFGLAFERNAARFQTFSFALDIRYLQNHCGARFFSRVRVYGHSDGSFAWPSRKLRPLLHLKRFLQSESVAVELLGLLEILHTEPRDCDFHCVLLTLEFVLLESMSSGARISANC